jgi:hypothetical protein
MDSGHLAKITARCLQSDPPPHLSHFDALFALAGLIRGSYDSDLALGDIETAVVAFLGFLDSITTAQLREADQNVYENVMQNVAELVEKFAPDGTRRLLTTLEKVMTSELLDKQLVAAQRRSESHQGHMNRAISRNHSWSKGLGVAHPQHDQGPGRPVRLGERSRNSV